jgi:hypothetical protein
MPVYVNPVPVYVNPVPVYVNPVPSFVKSRPAYAHSAHLTWEKSSLDKGNKTNKTDVTSNNQQSNGLQ